MDVQSNIQIALFTDYVREKHGDQMRQTLGREVPYWLHPLAVCNTLLSYGEVVQSDALTQTLALGGLGHDLVEDTDVTLSDIGTELMRIGVDEETWNHVITIIDECTDPKGMSRGEAVAWQIESMMTKHPLAALVKIADQLNNICDLDKWNRSKAGKLRYLEKAEKVVWGFQDERLVDFAAYGDGVVDLLELLRGEFVSVHMEMKEKIEKAA